MSTIVLCQCSSKGLSLILSIDYCQPLEITALLQYYADQGGHSSLKALNVLKNRLGDARSAKLYHSGQGANGKDDHQAALPDFFAMEC